MDVHLEIGRTPGGLVGQFPFGAVNIEPGVSGGRSIHHHGVGNAILIGSAAPPATAGGPHADKVVRLISGPALFRSEKAVVVPVRMSREGDRMRTGGEQTEQSVPFLTLLPSG